MQEDEARRMFAAFQEKTYGRQVMRTPSVVKSAGKRKATSKEGGDEDDDDEDEDGVNMSQTQPVRRPHFSQEVL